MRYFAHILCQFNSKDVKSSNSNLIYAVVVRHGSVTPDCILYHQRIHFCKRLFGTDFIVHFFRGFFNIRRKRYIVRQVYKGRSMLPSGFDHAPQWAYAGMSSCFLVPLLWEELRYEESDASFFFAWTRAGTDRGVPARRHPLPPGHTAHTGCCWTATVRASVFCVARQPLVGQPPAREGCEPASASAAQPSRPPRLAHSSFPARPRKRVRALLISATIDQY